jgi:hypothetical protein
VEKIAEGTSGKLWERKALIEIGGNFKSEGRVGKLRNCPKEGENSQKLNKAS